jgi:5-methylcytosine-specific restriction endonuclease McrA
MPSNCYLCGSKIDRVDAELDHITPKSKGGSPSLENLRWTHRMCNRIKHDMHLGDLRLLLEKMLSQDW